MSHELIMEKNRFFDTDTNVRKIAEELYEDVKNLPIVSPHGHTDPAWFAENQPFLDPTNLMLIPDHYIFRMLYSQGIAMPSLGVPTIDGSPVETDHRKIWQIFGDHYYLFSGTPSGIWFNHSLYYVFGVQKKLNSETAMTIYDQIAEKLQSPEYLPRALFDRFNIEVLSTTDSATDTLSYHKQIQESDWGGKVIPCFRPDTVVHLNNKDWMQNVKTLSDICGIDINSYDTFIQALENRRIFFKSMGAVSTDHAMEQPFTERLNDSDVNAIFQRALKGKATEGDTRLFMAHMLMEMARMSIEDGLAMQIHPGSFRDYNRVIFDRFGRDMGCDIPIQTEYTRNLRELLNAYGNDSRLTLIVFTLDESTYSRELAPLAGHYPAMKLGPSWWFHDSLEGMIRFRQQVTETAGIYNTVGFNDDTRAFPSIPARHDLSRRVDSNFLAGLAARHIIDMEDARRMSRDLAYGLVKKAYSL